MPTLILQRHLQSQWNLENRFSGWVDVPLSKEGREEAGELAEKISQFKIDVIYTSSLIRNTCTVIKICEFMAPLYPIFMHFKGKMKKWGNFTELNKNYIPVFVAEELNERSYGKLQGLNKEELKKQYGPEQMRLWQRSWKNGPPGGESLQQVYNRAVPFYKKYILKDLKKGKNILVVASHNSLRALMKHIEGIPDSEIINREIPFGGMVAYELNSSLNVINRKVQ